MDSCVTTAIANQSRQLALLHVSYGQRTETRERRAFDEIADFYGAGERLVVRLDALRQIGGSALTDTRIAVPEVPSSVRETLPETLTGETRENAPGDFAPQSGQIPITYVPFRNAHFLSVAVSWAEVIGASAIYIGAVEEDSSGYPDCRPQYYQAFSELIRQGTRPETRIEIATPVIKMSKAEIVRRGVELGAPLHLTWSCYQSEGAACGACESCRLRLRGFAQAGMRDPIA
jgi:7-cyano-7-deazaguanine synthase